MKTKWFYAPLEEASKKLDALYLNRSCIYQMVSKDRVVEGWVGTGQDGEHKQVLVHIVNTRPDRKTILISELNLVASN